MKNDNLKDLKDVKNIIDTIITPSSFVFASIAYLTATSLRKDILEIKESIEKNKG